MAGIERTKFVANGGWVERTSHWGPKTRIFLVLSSFWVVPTLGSLMFLVLEWQWSSEDTFIENLGRITLREWFAMALILAHPVWVGLAFHYAASETGETKTVLVPNPDHDLRKLY